MDASEQKETAKIACFGDSLTFGSVGYTYIRFLSPRFKAYDHGVNGDSTVCASMRLKLYMESGLHEDIDVFIVFIGINDIIIPFMKTLTPLWRLYGFLRCKLKRCLEEDEAFYAEYEKQLSLLSEHGKKVLMIGLPMLQLENFPQAKVQRRNEGLRRLAEKYGYPFLDFYEKEAAVPGVRHDFSWRHGMHQRVLDAAAMLFYPPSKKWFPKKRDLALTVDGVHFNETTARVLGETVSEYLQKYYSI